MPLTPFQEEVLRLLALDRSPESYLAGGAALHSAPNSIRYSQDLDFFHDSERRVAEAVSSRPATELGCLYFQASSGAFRSPSADRSLEEQGLVPHFGAPGGVVPLAVEG